MARAVIHRTFVFTGRISCASVLCWRSLRRPSGSGAGDGFEAASSDAGGVAALGKIDFDDLIAEVVSVTGWTWDQALDGLNVPRFLALRAEWRRHPPASWLLAAAFRYRTPDAEAVAKAPTVAELRAALT